VATLPSSSCLLFKTFEASRQLRIRFVFFYNT
jgi:hypothetical protein